MNRFKEAEIKTLLDQLAREEISFSRLVEIINERMIPTTRGIEFQNPLQHLAEKEEYKEHFKRIDQEEKYNK